jgi:hypothetical protein
MVRSKEKSTRINGFDIKIFISIPNKTDKVISSVLKDVDKTIHNYNKIKEDFLDKIIESVLIALKHNTDLVDSDKEVRIVFIDWGMKRGGFTAKNGSFRKYNLLGTLRGWLIEYIHYLSSNNLAEFIERMILVLIHEFTHCNAFKKLSARDALEKFRKNREKSLLLFLTLSLERQREEGLAVLRQAHALTSGGYHYKYHHDFRDFTLSMKRPSDFLDKAWVEFYKEIYPNGLSNMRDMVLAFRNRTRGLARTFHLNKGCYEKSNFKGFALNLSDNYGYYDYTYGTMMCYFIIIAELNDKDLNIIDFDTRRKISKRNVARKFIAGDNIAIGRIEPRKFAFIFTRMKHWNMFEFFLEYEKACNILGIPEAYRLISAKNAKDLISRKKDIISWMRK